MKDGYEPIHKLAMIKIHPQRNPRKRFSSFKIDDILKPVDSEDVSELLKVGREDIYEAGLGLSMIPRPGLFCTNNHGGLYQLNSNAIELCGSIRNGHRLDAVTRTALSMRSNTLHNNRFANVVSEPKIVRPWDVGSLRSRTEELARLQKQENEHLNVESSSDSEEEITVDDDPPPKLKRASPLDALVQMTSKTFEGVNGDGSPDGSRRDGSSGFGKSQPPRKKRKSRTAFTNQQIYELEKRFLYQKYLTPADRDEIAHSLGLTNAQVITWFQNRRAKLKRDLEELKNDVIATGSVDEDPRPHPSHQDRHYAVRLHQHQPVVNIHEHDDDMGISALTTACSLSPNSMVNNKNNNNDKNNINNNNNNNNNTNNNNNNEQRLHKICSAGLSRSSSCSSVDSNCSLTHTTTNSNTDIGTVTTTNTSDSPCNCVPPKNSAVDNYVPASVRL